MTHFPLSIRSRLPMLAAMLLSMTLAALMGSALGGCASSPPAGAKPTYVELFNQNKYQEAYTEASEAIPKSQGPAREQAQYYAGLSASRLNRHTDAEKLLGPLTQSRDTLVAGNASAELGLIALEKARFKEAAELLESASNKLVGNDAARAAVYAGDARRSMNELAAARSMWERAKALNPTDPTVRNMIDARLSPTAAPVNTGKYTVQLGAFSSRLNAQAQLDRHLARASGVGVPLRIVQVASRGRTLFAVRAGRFVSKPEADRIARELGPQAATVLVTGE